MLAGILIVLSIVLSAAAVYAQPLSSSREARILASGRLAVVDTLWSERGGRRSTRLTATIGSSPAVELHDGITVRTAVAASGDTLLVVAFHGGERPFARAHLVDAGGGGFVTRPTLELPLPAARGRLRPSAAVAAPTPDGFTVLVQEVDSAIPGADVRTTMYRVTPEGALASSREVPVPWALAALAWNGRGYHLALLWGGWGEARAGQARVCLVTLSPEGAPQQHPWWASPFDEVGEVLLVQRDDGAMQLVWRRGDARTIALADVSAVAGWGQEPAAPQEIARIAPDAPFAAIARDGRIAIVTP